MEPAEPGPRHLVAPVGQRRRRGHAAALAGPVRSGLLVLVLAGHALALEARPPGPGWEEANRTDDLVIFTHENEQVGARDIVAVSEIDAPPAVVFRVLGDYDHYPQFMPYTKETRTLEKKSETRLTVYQRLSPPIVDDRDYAIDVTLTPGTDENGGVYRTAWTPLPEAVPPRAGCVRVKINSGSWVLEPLDGGTRTRLTYNLQTHPGGSIPAWVANRSNTVAIPELFKAVRARALAQLAAKK